MSHFVYFRMKNSNTLTTQTFQSVEQLQRLYVGYLPGALPDQHITAQHTDQQNNSRPTPSTEFHDRQPSIIVTENQSFTNSDAVTKPRQEKRAPTTHLKCGRNTVFFVQKRSWAGDWADGSHFMVPDYTRRWDAFKKMV